MEKERAIELLIQAVDEIPRLKTLNYQNDEIKLWLDKVGNILRAGLKPEDYSKYWPVSQEIEILKGVYEDNIYQEEYLRKITNYEIALKSIIQKHQILGIETTLESATREPSTVDKPKALISHGKEKRPFEEAWEIEIQGDVQTLCPIVMRVANEVNVQNYALEARPANSKTTNTYAWFDILSINRTTADSTPIGVVTLESLGNNRVILRVPPHSRWLHGDLSPRELMMMAYGGAQYDEHFNQFMKSLEDSLIHYDLVITLPKVRLWRKIWQSIKSHKILSIIITIIMLIGAIITIVGFISGFFS